MVAIALKAEEVGLDVFATGEHHNPPFVPSSPTTMLGHIAAQTEKLILSTSTTLITTNDPVKIAEDFAMLQHLADGRVDLMMGRGNTGPVYPGSARTSARASTSPSRTTPCCAGCGARTSSTGRASSAARCRASPPPRVRWTVWRRSSGTAPSAPRRSPNRPPTTATASSTTTSSGRPTTPSGWSLYRERYAHYGHGTPEQAIVGLGRQVFMRKNSQDAVREFRPYFDNAPVYGHGPSLEEFTDQTPLTVGSPQEVIEKTLAFREYAGDYQRQLFLVDHAGLPLKTVLEQLDLLGEEVDTVLRKEFRERPPCERSGGTTTSPCSLPPQKPLRKR